MMVRVADIINLLSRLRLPLNDEKELQSAIECEFDRAGIIHEREYRLSTKDIIDFKISGIGIEIKIRGSKRRIYDQVRRYAEHDCIKELILITNVPMGFPPEVKGKPVYLLNLARAWL